MCIYLYPYFKFFCYIIDLQLAFSTHCQWTYILYRSFPSISLDLEIKLIRKFKIIIYYPGVLVPFKKKHKVKKFSNSLCWRGMMACHHILGRHYLESFLCWLSSAPHGSPDICGLWKTVLHWDLQQVVESPFGIRMRPTRPTRSLEEKSELQLHISLLFLLAIPKKKNWLIGTVWGRFNVVR